MVGDPAGAVNAVSEVVLDEAKCPLPVGVSLLGQPKLAIVNPTFAGAVQKCKPGVEHFVVENEADHVLRNQRVVESPVEDDGVVSRVVMTKTPSALRKTPSQLVNREGVLKEPAVEVPEELPEVEYISRRWLEPLPSALSSQFLFLIPGIRKVEKAVAQLGHGTGSFPAGDLVDEPDAEGFDNGIWCFCEKVGQPDLEDTASKPNRAREAGVRIELDMNQLGGPPVEFLE